MIEKIERIEIEAEKIEKKKIENAKKTVKADHQRVITSNLKTEIDKRTAIKK